MCQLIPDAKLHPVHYFGAYSCKKRKVPHEARAALAGERPTQGEAEVPAEGEAHVHVTIQKGGRLQISATDESGRHLAVKCRLVDPHGQAVKARFIAKRDGEDYTVCAVGGFPGVGPFWTMHALEEGEWRIEIESDGYEPEARRVMMRAGKPTLLQVTLHPTPR